MPAADICGQTIPNCGTIDFTAEEALLNARIAFPGASTHEDTSEAVNKLLSSLETSSAQLAMIVGHGTPGTIVTGTGREATDQDKRIALDINSLDIWPSLLAQLEGQIAELTLCSCETGADNNGAKLLAKVANNVAARVSGFTGMIFIDGIGNITCEKGGEWQHADPGILPPPIPRPQLTMESIVNLRLKEHGEFRTLPISEVSSVRYFDSSDERKGGPRVTLQGDEAQRLVSTINFAIPSEIKGAPLALVTGQMEIVFKENRAWTFIIYNDRLFQDQSAPDTFYFASTDFIPVLSEYLNSPDQRS